MQTGSQRVGDQMSWRQDVVGRPPPSRRGTQDPRLSLETSWWEDAGWEHVPGWLGPQAPGWAVQENENDTRLCPEGLGRSIYCISVRSPTPSHTQTFQIKWEVYFSKNCVARLYYCVNMYSACICVYMHIYYVAIQQDVRFVDHK